MPPARKLDVRLVIAQRLRDIRFDRKETQLVVGRRARIHRPIIGRIERGTHAITIPVLKRLCRALRVDPYEVVRVLDGYDIDPRSGRCTPKERPRAWGPRERPMPF
jgi:transcriptional regulator with XRE-family HTH domain